ncbi:hypothetical protein Agub_g8832 [Astrephomene gubernaculifera]|uniref:ribose-5-phosphate isomerase n=1 Tax=Astrephomene gubernaculifera TaxID=47775 RepID=A0AAD3DV03_9CHLO|nr:hypothetical protein Agub_g8832 [Astrephomene gubernaculifera]
MQSIQRCRVRDTALNRGSSRRTLAIRCSKPNIMAEAKREAARVCVDRFVRNNTLLALGQGEMVNLVVAEVGRRLAEGSLQDVAGVPVCDMAAHEAAFHGLPLVPESRAGEASLLLADADQFDPAANAALLGCACEPQQPDVPRLLRAAAVPTEAGEAGPRVVLLTEASRVVSRLGGVLPVWLDADVWEEAAEQLDDIFLGDAEIWRRSFTGQPEDPRGGEHPYISPQGHTIVDVRFYEGLKLYGEDEPYDKIADEVRQVEGVVAHGLLIGRAAAAVVARAGEEGPQVLEFQ